MLRGRPITTRSVRYSPHSSRTCMASASGFLHKMVVTPCAVIESGSDTGYADALFAHVQAKHAHTSHHLYTYLRTHARAIAAQDTFFQIHARAAVLQAQRTLAAAAHASPAAFAPVVDHQPSRAPAQRLKRRKIPLEGAHVGVDLGAGLHAHGHRVDPRPGEDVVKRRARGGDQVPPPSAFMAMMPAPWRCALAIAPSICSRVPP